MNMEYIQDYLANCKSPVQLVKHMDEVPERQINYPLIAQKKYDGLYVLMIVTHDDTKFFSRTGKEYYWELTDKLESFWDDVPIGVYIGELCNDTISLEALAGLVSTNRKAIWDEVESHDMQSSYIMFHDFLTLDEFLDGYSAHTYDVRLANLFYILENMELTEYFIGYTLVNSYEEAEVFADTIITEGGEGAVFKHYVDWQAGHKGYRAMKIVRGLTLDLLCTGVQYGKGKREGQIAKLELSYKGNRFFADLGKGWTDERRNLLTLAYETYSEGYTCSVYDCTLREEMRNPVGKIWEVKALQESSTGKALRLPKVQRVREDKTEPDA